MATGAQSVGCVYVAEDLRSGLIKVGRSSEPWNRLLTLRSECQHKDVVMAYMTRPRENVILIESRAHQILAPHRADGHWEWFCVPRMDAELAVRQAVVDVRKGWAQPQMWIVAQVEEMTKRRQQLSK